MLNMIEPSHECLIYIREKTIEANGVTVNLAQIGDLAVLTKRRSAAPLILAILLIFIGPPISRDIGASGWMISGFGILIAFLYLRVKPKYFLSLGISDGRSLKLYSGNVENLNNLKAVLTNKINTGQPENGVFDLRSGVLSQDR